jgi:hypothetical protein
VKKSLSWFRLRWPREVAPDQILQLTRLLASAGGTPLVIETVGSAGMVEHRLGLVPGHAESVVDQLRAALPGLAIESLGQRPAVHVRRLVELRLTTRLRPVGGDIAVTNRALLTALAQTHKHEYLTVQWVLSRRLPSRSVPSQAKGIDQESWLSALLLAPFNSSEPLDSERRSRLSEKHSAPGWRAIGRIGVATRDERRQKQLIGVVLGALRMSEAPGVRWWAVTKSHKRLVDVSLGWRRPLQLNANELAVLSTFPAGTAGELPVDVIGSRLMRPSKAIRRRGRVIGESNYPGAERPVALSPKDSLRHLHVIAPTGAGKSTLLLNLAAGDIEAGRAIVVIEPKSDLISGILERIPASRINDVVLLDPTYTENAVGLNPLALHGRSPYLVADELLGLFHSLYENSWGPRTHDILGASLLTLAKLKLPLTALPRLLSDAGFRRRVLPKVVDPVGLGPFWSHYEAWSEPQRIEAIGPVMNKLRPVLLRPEMTAILGQGRGFDLKRIFTERKILLVNLAKGLIGPETSALLGAVVIAMLWQAILGRVVVPQERRHPAFVYVDEFQNYLHLPTDLADALAESRGLGVGWVLAHQYLHQLGPAMRAGVLANSQSRIALRLAHEDARVIASGSALAPEDFSGLRAWEAYAQLVADDAVQPWCSIKTFPEGKTISDPEVVRAASRQNYGIEQASVEADLIELFAGRSNDGQDDLTPRRRPIQEPL